MAVTPEKPFLVRRDPVTINVGEVALMFISPKGLWELMERGAGTSTKPRVIELEPKSAPIGKKSEGRLPTLPRPEPPKRPSTPPPRVKDPDDDDRPGPFGSLFGSVPRLFATLVMLALLTLAVMRFGRPLAFILFSDSHPEWFETDLPPNLMPKK